MYFYRVALALLVCLICGCVAEYTYYFESRPYHSANAAFEAQQIRFDEILSKISKSPVSDSRSVMVITPSSYTIEDHGLKKSNSGSRKMIKHMSDFAGQFAERGYLFYPKFLEKAGLFSHVDSKISDNPQTEAIRISKEQPIVIYLAVKSPTQIGWFIIVNGNEKHTQINFDALSEPGAPRINSWIEAVATAIVISKN